MSRPVHLIVLGWGAFALFAILAGLALLVGANHASPGCTGPAVERCDYILTASAAVAQSGKRRFEPDLGFEVYDRGSTVLVQQFSPSDQSALFHGSAVLIDKNSCRACSVEGRYPTGGDVSDSSPGVLLSRTPAERTGPDAFGTISAT